MSLSTIQPYSLPVMTANKADYLQSFDQRLQQVSTIDLQDNQIDADLPVMSVDEIDAELSTDSPTGADYLQSFDQRLQQVSTIDLQDNQIDADLPVMSVDEIDAELSTASFHTQVHSQIFKQTLKQSAKGIPIPQKKPFFQFAKVIMLAFLKLEKYYKTNTASPSSTFPSKLFSEIQNSINNSLTRGSKLTRKNFLFLTNNHKLNLRTILTPVDRKGNIDTIIKIKTLLNLPLHTNINELAELPQYSKTLNDNFTVMELINSYPCLIGIWENRVL